MRCRRVGGIAFQAIALTWHCERLPLALDFCVTAIPPAIGR
jgi:hypothetical protein